MILNISWLGSFLWVKLWKILLYLLWTMNLEAFIATLKDMNLEDPQAC
jgi:hypothetical protein